MNHRRQVFKNIFNLGLIDSISMVIPIVSLPLLTKSLESSAFGFYMLFITVVYFGHTIVDYGTQYSGIRQISLGISEKKSLAPIYEETQGMRFALLMIYLCLVTIYGIFSSSVEHILLLTLGSAIYLAGYILMSSWFLQGTGQTSSLAIVSISTKLTHLFLIFLFVKSPEDLSLAIYLFSLMSLLGGLLLSFKIRIKLNARLFICKNVLTNLKDNFDVFVGILSPNFYNAIPTIALGSYSSSQEFARFAIAIRLCDVIVTFQNVLAKAFFPIISKIKKDFTPKLIAFNFLFSIPLIGAILIFENQLISYFLGVEYISRDAYLKILMTGVLFIGMTNGISQGYFLTKGKDKLFKTISIRVSIVSAAISYILIFAYSFTGAAIGISLARLMFFASYLSSYFKETSKAQVRD